MTEKDEWLADETPGIYIWRAPVGWWYRVMFDFAGTVTMWRPTRSGARRAAQRIAAAEI